MVEKDDFSTKRNLLLIALHAVFGIAAAYSSLFSTLWVLTFFVYSFLRVVTKKNSDGFAHFAAAYIVGIEVLLRMTHSSIFYEFGKYGVSTLLFTGMFLENTKRKTSFLPIFYFLLLLPSLAVCSFDDFETGRQQIAFNLSGPFCLMISWLYFQGRRITKLDLEKIFMFIILPLIATVFVIFQKMPSIREISFNEQSNFDTSGGFGPNQVSVALGAGFFLLSIAWLLKCRVTGNILLDRFLMIVFLGFGVFTFSRGGVIVPILVLIGCLIIYIRTGIDVQKFKRILGILVGVSLVSVLVYFYLNNLSGNAIENRYAKTFGESEIAQINDVDKTIDLSGREDLAKSEFEMYLSNPVMGVGPGMAYSKHDDYLGIKIAAHTELTRLLAEHGTYGLFAFLIILVAPWKKFGSLSVSQKVITFAMISFALSTMMHAAMRTSVTAYFFGFGFVNFQDIVHSLERSKQSFSPPLAIS